MKEDNLINALQAARVAQKDSQLVLRHIVQDYRRIQAGEEPHNFHLVKFLGENPKRKGRWFVTATDAAAFTPSPQGAAAHGNATRKGLKYRNGAGDE